MKVIGYAVKFRGAYLGMSDLGFEPAFQPALGRAYMFTEHEARQATERYGGLVVRVARNLDGKLYEV